MKCLLLSLFAIVPLAISAAHAQDAPQVLAPQNADDGKIYGALSWDSLFLLDSAGASEGTIYLAAPTLIYDAN